MPGLATLAAIFLGIPPWLKRAIAIGLAILAVGTTLYVAGGNAERRKCNAAALQAQIATLKIDLDIAQKRAKENEAAAKELAQTAENQSKEIAEYVAREKDNPACLSGDVDFDYFNRGMRRKQRN